MEFVSQMMECCITNDLVQLFSTGTAQTQRLTLYELIDLYLLRSMLMNVNSTVFQVIMGLNYVYILTGAVTRRFQSLPAWSGNAGLRFPCSTRREAVGLTEMRSAECCAK